MAKFWMSLLQAVPPDLCDVNLSKRQQRALAMEGTAYKVCWVGEPTIVQDPSCKHLLSTDDGRFILQHARDKGLGSQPKEPAAYAHLSGPKKPSQQATKGAASHCNTLPPAHGVRLACRRLHSACG